VSHPVNVAELGWFLGWLVAVALLFWVALRLPLQSRLRPLFARLYTVGVIVALFAVVGLANFALILHDAHIDLTREKVFTPSDPALEVADNIDRPVRLTYFFQSDDPNGARAADIVKVMGRRNALLEIRTIDPDKEPTVAETYGIKLYNAAVIEAEGRRVVVNTTDETEIAIGIQRVLRVRVVTICFMEGHGEYRADNYEYHTHLEGLAGHSHGDSASAVVKMPGHGVGRLRRSLESLGYDARQIVPASEDGIPPDCNLVIDAGPRTTFLPAESAALEDYLRRGGSVLLMFDLGFVLAPGLERLVGTLGVRLPQAVVVDPKSHYATDPEMVAVTAYDKHPITRNVSFTFYPGVRPLTLTQAGENLRATALISSSNESYTKPVTPVQQREITVAGAPSAADADADSEAEQQPHVLAAAIEGTLPGADGQPFRSVVIGDSDFATNSFYPYMANSDLVLAMVRWLVREEREAPITSRIPVPPLVLLTRGQMQGIFLLVEVLLPLSVIALGGWMWWRQR
jgi:hypothetical protein